MRRRCWFARPLLVGALTAVAACNRTATFDSGAPRRESPSRDESGLDAVRRPNEAGIVGWDATLVAPVGGDDAAAESLTHDSQSPESGNEMAREAGESGLDCRPNTVVLVSIDGLAARFLEAERDAGRLPAFEQLQREGLFTHDAHTDPMTTVTLPNHTSMITGRPAIAPPGFPEEMGHGFLINSDPGEEYTLHNYATGTERYLPSAFDEVHERGGYTSLYSGKNKFLVYRRSYSASFARPDTRGVDDGSDKIDDFDILTDSEDLVEAFLNELEDGVSHHAHGPNFALFHFRDTDAAGHRNGWGSPSYLDALHQSDRVVGEILERLRMQPALRRTGLILTTDHGGVDYGHSDVTDPFVFRIPFYIWGPCLEPGDLYAAVGDSRVDPGELGPFQLDETRPIRNGDAANLALKWLGVSPIPGSFYDDVPAPSEWRWNNHP